MISQLRSALLALYVSGCAVVASSSVGPERNSERMDLIPLSPTEMVTGYAGSTVLDSSVNNAFHGFKVGVRTEGYLARQTVDLSENGTINTSFNSIPLSTEVSFRGLFGEDRNLYEFGMSNGFRILGRNSDHSLEIVASPARMGIASGGGKYWTPQAGLEYNFWPFQLQAGGDFYVGKEKGAGVFVNGGFAF